MRSSRVSGTARCRATAPGRRHRSTSSGPGSRAGGPSDRRPAAPPGGAAPRPAPAPRGRLMDEPVLVVESREHLWYLLTEASQLEHMIMCQYLYAMFSLKSGADESLTEAQAEAVARWRGVLSGICIDEMLHLALVANVTAAIGAAPTVSRPNFPQRSGYFPPSVQLDL